MSRSDDLARLFNNGNQAGTGFRQGVIVTWNPDTAENTVSVAGTIMNNLPILNTSEASLLGAGDVVAIITSGASFAILGRLVIPGTADAVSSIQAITNRIQAAQDTDDGTRNSTSWGDLTGSSVGPAVTIRVGSSGRVLAFWSAELGQTEPTGSPGVLQAQSKNTPHVGIQLSGANTATPNVWEALNFNLEHTSTATSFFWLQAASMHLYTGLSSGDTTFTMKYRHDGQNPAANSVFSAREIAVFAL